jgi:hypothetical protein
VPRFLGFEAGLVRGHVGGLGFGLGCGYGGGLGFGGAIPQVPWRQPDSRGGEQQGHCFACDATEVAVLQPANRLKLRLEFFPPGGDILQPLHGQDGAVLHDRLVGRPCAPLPEAPLTLLVRKLQNALVSLERFSVVLSHAPPSSSGTASIAAGLSALTQPFKLRLCRATEDFLWPCIKWQEAAAASGAGASTSEESTPIAVSGTERRSTRSRSTVGGANASGQLLKVEAALQILTFCVRTQPMRWW